MQNAQKHRKHDPEATFHTGTRGEVLEVKVGLQKARLHVGYKTNM